MLLAFGFYSWSIRIGFTCWEIGILSVLYYFTGAINTNRIKQGKTESKINQTTVLYIYAFSPITILNLIFGQPWFLGVFFSLLGTYAFYKQKPVLTGLIFCLGFLTQLYPAFILIPIVTFYLSKKRWKDLGTLIGTFALSFVIFCLPFYFLDPELFLFNFLTHLSRTPQTATFWTFLESVNVNSLSLFGMYDISVLGLISLTFTGVFVILTYLYFKRNKETNETNVLWAGIIYYLFLPAIFLTLDFRYCYWAFPLLSILFIQKVTPKQSILMGLTGVGLTLGMSLLFIFKMPELLVIDQRIYYDLPTILTILSISMIFFLVSLPIYLILWFQLGKQLKTKYQVLNLHQTITLVCIIFTFQLFVYLFPSSVVTIGLFLISLILGILMILRQITSIIRFQKFSEIAEFFSASK